MWNTARPFALMIAAAAVGAACAEPAGEASSEDDLTRRTFVDASPDFPLSGHARTKLVAALGKLDRVAKRAESPLRRALAAETLARIEGGQVRLGSIAGARGIDRWHMCKDYDLPACAGAPPAADDRTWRGDDQLGETLERELAGYMWNNNLYFTLRSATDTDDLAATLVHEVNHVFHRSECSYYRNVATHEVDPERAFVEEYRAFLTECYFTHDTTATPETCHAIAFASALDYGFNADLTPVLPAGEEPVVLAQRIVGAERGGDASFGHIVPRAELWPTSFGVCPAR